MLCNILSDTCNICRGRILAPEVRASFLHYAVGSDILDCRITDVADREHDWVRSSTGHNTKVVSKCKDRPVIRDAAEPSVLCVVEYTMIDELSTDQDVLTDLIRRIRGLQIHNQLLCQRHESQGLTAIVEWSTEPSG